MMFAFAAVRGLHLVSLMLLFGSALLLLRLHVAVPELGLESRALRRLRLAAASLALASGLLWMGFAASQMAGGASPDAHTVRLTLQATLFGQVFLVRLALLLLLCLALLGTREWLVLVLSGAALALVSVTSHAGSDSPFPFSIVGITGDAVHLLCAGIWLGGLLALAFLLAERRDAPRRAQAIALFAQWGMAAVALLAMTGLINVATVLLGSGVPSRLYLGVLGAKLVLVLAMVVLAVSNHFRLLPRLARPEAAAALKGNIAWELGLGALVVLLAALLGLLPPTL